MNPHDPLTDALRRAAGEAEADEQAWRRIEQRLPGRPRRHRLATRITLVVAPLVALGGIAVGVAESLASAGGPTAVVVPSPSTTAPAPTTTTPGPATTTPGPTTTAPATAPSAHLPQTSTTVAPAEVPRTTPTSGHPVGIVPPAPGTRSPRYPKATSADLPLLLRSHAGPEASSALAQTAQGSLAAVAYGEQHAHLEIARWTGIAWHPVAVLRLGYGGIDRYVDNLPIVVAHLTRTGLPEFAVQADYATGPVLSVASHASGTWKLLDFAEGEGSVAASAYLRAAKVSGSAVVQQRDNCLPNCAQGTTTTVVYRWDGAKAEMVPR